MMGFKMLSDGVPPHEDHRNAWAELADHLERAGDQPMPALVREAIVSWDPEAGVPWRIMQFAYRLRATNEVGIAEGVADLRILAGSGAIAPDRARDLYVYLHHVVRSEVVKTWF
jgi:hypothetical protein